MDYSTIHIRHDSPTPLYQQIADQITEAAQQGTLKPEEKLPPIRRLAGLLGVSPITVTQAYQALARAGVAGGQIGRGTFILPAPAQPESRALPPQSDFPPALERAVAPPATEWTREGWTMTLTRRAPTPRSVALGQIFDQLLRGKSEQSFIDFSSGNPDPSLFSLAHWQQIMEQAGKSLDQESREQGDAAAFQYGPAMGDAALRSFLTGYLQRFGLSVTTDNILLTSGTQQGLDLIARTFFEPGDSVFVEQLSYIAALDIFEQYGVHLQPVPMDEDGLQVEAFEHLPGAPHSRQHWLYTIPTAHSPTGTCMTVERRRRLVELARAHNMLIIEDDAFNELSYEKGMPAPAIWSFAPQEMVIYVKSFSKTTFPAARLGCIVAAPEILSSLAEKKGLVDRGTSLLVARSVLTYLKSPAYERNLEQMRSVYRQRRDVLLAALERELGSTGCSWSYPCGGFSLLVTLPASLHVMEVVEEAIARDVVIAPGRFFTPAVAGTHDNTLRLTFADKPPELLEEATLRLGLVVRALFQRGGQSAYPSHRLITDV
ncbi:MAG TPA: PLP-dependent aminotransferase family protein [Ktedonobacteraceae bacterium]